ncbi:MAG: hypothetical protein M3R59_10390 [Verrucomicrobiota bacterium]|nr:hypothetical protein [Verrucomicrobiota bacterium]
MRKKIFALLFLAASGQIVSAEEPPQILPPETSPIAAPAKVPADIPGLPELDSAFTASPLGKEAIEARLHLLWRELVNRTKGDADLVALRVEAKASRVDPERRQLLRKYYVMLFERMRAKAGTKELKDYLTAREKEHIALLAQPRVRPNATP